MPVLHALPSSPTKAAQAEPTALAQYALTDRQDFAIWSWRERRVNELLYGGAKGGGKSFLLRFLWCMFALAAPGIQLYLFRRTFPDLWKNHMEGESGFPRMLAPQIRRKECAIVGHNVRFANGSRIYLNHLQLKKHVLKYQGMEIH